MNRIESHDDSVINHEDDIVDLGAASALTQGVPGLVEEFENRIPQAGLSD